MCEYPYNINMSALFNLLNQNNYIKILSALVLCRGQGLHLRDLALLTNLPASTVSDVTTKLVSLKIINKHQKGNKVYFTETLTAAEIGIINHLIEHAQSEKVKSSSKDLSKKALQILQWNSEMIETIISAKNTNAAT